MRRAFIALVTCSSFLLAASWLAGSALAQDIGAAHEAVCCGATCCLVDGQCKTDGMANDHNPCEVCNPAMSQSEWTPVPGCVPPDAGAEPVEPDAGTPVTPPRSGGCAASGTGGPLGLGFALGVAGLALVWRRRR
jgi:MYXO-CTERM domain-containing protein